MATWLRPAHVPIRLTSRYKGALQTPTTTLITVEDPNGNAVTGVDEVAMTEDSNGRLQYDYDTDLDADNGTYKVIFKATYANLIEVITDSFEVKDT